MDPHARGIAEAGGHLVAEKLDAIRDPDFRAICLEYDAAFDWSADDPRLEAVAARAARWVTKQRGKSKRAATAPDPTVVRLVAMTLERSPALDRLNELAKERLTEQQIRS